MALVQHNGQTRRSTINENTKETANATDLKLWVFRLTNDSFGVCVEGYRKADEAALRLENWRSTEIAKRESSDTVITGSGSKYRLIGCIDEAAALQLGYPKTLINRFKNGFPSDWKNILKDYYEKLKKKQSLNVSTVNKQLGVSGIESFFTKTQSAPNKENAKTKVVSPKVVRTPEVSMIEEKDEDTGTPFRMPCASRIIQEDKQVRRSPRIAKATLEFCETPETKKNVSATPTSSTSTRSTRRLSLPGGTPQSKTKSSPKTRGRKSLDACSPSVESLSKNGGSVEELSSRTRTKVLSPLVAKSGSIEILAVKEAPLASPSLRTPRKSGKSVENLVKKETETVAPPPVIAEVPETPTKTPARKKGRPTKKVEQSLAVVPFTSQPPPALSDEDREPVFKMPQADIYRAPAPSSQITRLRESSIFLSEWCFTFVPQNDQVPIKDYPPFVLFGKNISSEFNGEWCTSIIVKVLDKTLFQTYNGKLYSVSGSIHEKAAARFGYPKEYVDKFSQGFPVSWRNDLRSIYDFVNSRCVRYDNFDIDASMAFNPKGHFNETRANQTVRNNRNNVRQSMVPPKPANEAQKVRRTSSGRVVHEPLAYWAGQRVKFNNEGQAVGVEGVSTKTVHTGQTQELRDVAGAYGFKAPKVKNVERDAYRQPHLAVEGSGRKRKRHTLVTYSDSSNSDDHNDPYINTLKEISYEDSPLIRKRGKPKRRCVDSGDSDDDLLELELLRKDVIKREKRRLAKRQKILEDMERRAMEATRRNRLKKDKEKKARQLDDHFLETQERERMRRMHDDVYESTETEVSDGGEWVRSPALKAKRKQKLPKRRSKEQLESDSSSSEDYEDERESRVPKKMTWKKEDIERLKLALAAIKIKRESDWEKIARSLGGTWNPMECKETAEKKLKWSQDQQTEEVDLGYIEVTAKQGTLAYEMQAETRGRQYMMGAGSQEDDFFRNNDTALNATFEAPIPDVAAFDPNDSLLSAIKTPVIVNPTKKVGRNRLAFVPEGLNDDDIVSSNRRSARLSIVPDEARDDQQRYMHHLNRQKNQSHNQSKLQTSMFNTTTAGARKKAAQDVTRKIEAIEKGARGRRRKQQSDISEEEDDY
ncbi:unnamed protein product [Auanema sp. JU1783]|nr:unnamed protein product [Auanema sp. JU1783]